MLTYFRERVSRTFITVILMLIAIAFALVGLQGHWRDQPNHHVLAYVGDEEITLQEWQQAYWRLLMLLSKEDRARLASDVQAQRLWRKRAFEHVQMTKATESGLRDLGYHLNRLVLDRSLRNLEAFQQDGRFSSVKFRSYLKDMNTNEQTFLESLRLDVLLSQLNDVMSLSGFLLTEEVDQWLDLATQKRTISYVPIDASTLPNQVARPQAIESYYQSHKEQWQTPEKIKVDYMILDPKKMHMDPPSQAALLSFYHDHIRWFTQPAAFQCEVIEIVSNAQNGKLSKPAIERLLRRYHGSEDQQVQLRTLLERNDRHWQIHAPTLEKKAYRWYSLASLPQVVSQALQALDPGQSTAPIDIHGRYYVYRLVKKRTVTTQSFSAVKAKVSQLYNEQLRQEKWSDQVEQLRDLAYAYPNGLGDVAKHMGVSVLSSKWLIKGGHRGLHQLFDDPSVLDQVIFDPTWLSSGHNTEPLSLQDGRLILLHQVAHQRSQVQPLAQIRAQVEKAYRAFYANQRLSEHAQMVIDHWRKDPNDQPKGVRTMTFNPLKPQAIAPFDQAIVEQCYAMDFSDHRIMRFERPGGGYWVVRLDSVKRGDMISHDQRRSLKIKLKNQLDENDFYLLQSVLLADKQYKIEDQALLSKVLSTAGFES